jgi:hypothetical protein
MWPQCGTRNFFAGAKPPIFLKNRTVAPLHRLVHRRLFVPSVEELTARGAHPYITPDTARRRLGATAVSAKLLTI